jgi:hypothetical protein
MLDGVDVDYEDFDAMNLKDGRSEKWLIDFTTALRKELPAPKFILTHAPVAPWSVYGYAPPFIFLLIDMFTMIS